jgi:hypothetical protein
MTPVRLFASSAQRRFGDAFFPILSQAASACVFVLFVSVAAAPAIPRLPADSVVRNFFALCALLLAFFSCLFAWFTSGYYFGKRRREIAVWTLLGIPRRTVFALSVFESAVGSTVSFAVGLAAALVLNRFSSLVLGYLLEAGGGVPLPFNAAAATAAVVLFAAQIGAASLKILMEVGRTSPSCLAGADGRRFLAEGGRPPSAILGAVLLSAAYAAAWAGNSRTSVFLALPVLVSAVAGTFFFCDGLPPVLAALARRRRQPGPIPLLSLSLFAFRRRRTARIWSLASILVAVAATAGGTMHALAANADLQTDRLTPNDVEFWCSDPSVFQQNVDRIGAALAVSEPDAKAGRVFFPDSQDDPRPALPSRRPGLRGGRCAAVFRLERTDPGIRAEQAGDAVRFGGGRRLSAFALSCRAGSGDRRGFPGCVGDAASGRGGGGGRPGPRQFPASGRLARSGLGSPLPGDRPDEGRRLEFPRPFAPSRCFLGAGTELLIRGDAVREYGRESRAFKLIGSVMTAVFIVAAAAVVAFDQLDSARSDADACRRLRLLGMADADLRRLVSVQVMLSFAVPFILGAFHAAFALRMVASLSRFRVLESALLVIAASAASFATFLALIRFRRLDSAFRQKT